VNYIGIGVSFIILYASALAIIIDFDASKELDIARQAVKVSLHCIAHARSIPVDLKDARYYGADTTSWRS
jgi:hypothetical protein